jgi:hypothetical protein
MISSRRMHLPSREDVREARDLWPYERGLRVGFSPWAFTLRRAKARAAARRERRRPAETRRRLLREALAAGCCKWTDGVPCGEPCTAAYRHGEDLCGFCAAHDTPCGKRIWSAR